MKKFEEDNSAGQRTGFHDRGLYDGAELRPFDGRAGSMDAYELPSLGMGMSMYRYARRTKDSTQPVEPPAQVEDSN